MLLYERVKTEDMQRKSFTVLETSRVEQLGKNVTGKISNQFNVVKIRFMNIKIVYTQSKVSLRKPKKSDDPL